MAGRGESASVIGIGGRGTRRSSTRGGACSPRRNGAIERRSTCFGEKRVKDSAVSRQASSAFPLGGPVTQPLSPPSSSIEPISTGSRAVIAVKRAAFGVDSGVGAPLYAGRSHPPALTVARMIDALRLPSNAKVLLVGSGSGYAAAVLAQVCKEVWGIERVASLVTAARGRLEAFGIENVNLREGDGRKGWAEEAPFDAILVMSILEGRPTDLDALIGQLAEGAALVKPFGSLRNDQRLLRLTRRGDGPPEREDLGPVEFSVSVGEMLGALGIADRALVVHAESLARESGRSVIEELGKLIPIEDGDLLHAFAAMHGMNFGTVGNLATKVDPKLFERVPRAFCDHHQILPISREDGVIRVASTRPTAPFGDIGRVFPGERIEPWLVTATDFKRLWSVLELRLAGEEMKEEAAATEEPGLVAGSNLLGRTDSDVEARAVTLFEALMLDAISERASDIHLERYGDRTRVRIRVDGDLEDLTRYRFTPLEMVALVNVIKIRAHLDISERRVPQGGRCRIDVGGPAFDLRVQTQPALHGEHVIIRILPQEQRLLTIEGLGFPGPVAKHYRRLLDNPGGLVLVVGPTGSGKSTTLYAALQVLARDTTRKVITIEDPIEYALDGIQQVQVRKEIGFAFADAMRAFVREDPDVILVGEIRDTETALEALRASQTGHLVLSTLHSNDATDAMQRLFDLGMHPNSIASELLAVISQRLAKRICEGCREPVEPDPELLAEVFPAGAPKDFRCFAGKGCGRCTGHGTRGRIAVVEFLRATPNVRRAISRHVPVDEMRSIALDDGLVSARESALAHVAAGSIALDQLRDLLPAERMGGEAPLAW